MATKWSREFLFFLNNFYLNSLGNDVSGDRDRIHKSASAESYCVHHTFKPLLQM